MELYEYYPLYQVFEITDLLFVRISCLLIRNYYGYYRSDLLYD